MQSDKTLSQTSIFTIGHSNVDTKKFLSLLNGFEVLVDVRGVPFSKYVPQFNQNNLKKEVENCGIEYVFLKNNTVGNLIGGRPKDADCYTNGEISYEKVMEKEWYKTGISKLINIASKKSTVIMCSEEDPYKCHRHNLIAQTLLKKGIIVFHIRGDGRREKIEKPLKKTIQLTLM